MYIQNITDHKGSKVSLGIQVRDSFNRYEPEAGHESFLMLAGQLYIPEA